MNRYENIETKKNTNGIRYLSSINYPNIEQTQFDTWIIAKKTDRLDLLATQYYSDPRFWVVIAKANSIKGTLKIPVGKRIRIPYLETPTEYQQMIINNNN